MRSYPRFTAVLAGLGLIMGLTTAGMSQTQTDDSADIAKFFQGSNSAFVKVAPRTQIPADITSTPTVTSGMTLVFPDGASSKAGFSAASGVTGNSGFKALPHPAEEGSDEGRRPNRSTIDGVDTLATFAGSFITQNGPSTGVEFPFTMIGNHPLAGGTTVIPAPITTVNLKLLNPDGSLNTTVPFTFRDLVEDSPNFAEHSYRSGRHIQYADAVHRAQFFNRMGDDWHTVLNPKFVNDVTFTIPRFVNVTFRDGTVRPVQAYFLGTLPDGTHFVFLFDLLFNFLFDNQVISDINAGNFNTNSISMLLMPNTLLFSVNGKGQPAGCCVLGFHTFFEANAVPQPRFVTQFASWLSHGVLNAGFEDVTALSHETSEAFADPFLGNATASWQFPNLPAGVCQGNLEEGDPVENLPTVSVPITLRERKEVFTYHPQIIPLLQWFEMGATSNAIDGAFSFPDETTLPTAAQPCPQ